MSAKRPVLPSRRDWTVLVMRLARVSALSASVTHRTHFLRWLAGRPSKLARTASSCASAAARSAGTSTSCGPAVTPITAVMAAANASGASSGEKWPTPPSPASVTAAKNSPIRSDHSRGNSGSYSGQSTVVGTAILRSGACSASAAVTEPAPALYQAIEAAKAPGGPYTATRWSRWSLVGS